MNSHRLQLLLWAEQGALDSARLPDALRFVGAFPTADDWRQFADWLLLALAVLALSSGVIFFFAYNWDALGRFSRFALAEGALALALFGVWRLGLERSGGQASLFAAALCLGALLALLGQTYQTGADIWELFAFWCALLLPWALLGRQALLWLFLLALFNVALYLYLGGASRLRFLGFDWLPHFAANLVALALWEGVAWRLAEWNRRWALRLTALAVTLCVTYDAVVGVWVVKRAHDFYPEVDALIFYPGVDALILWALWAAGFGYFYRCRARDFFMLVAVAASFLLLANSALIRVIAENRLFDGIGTLPLAGMLMIGIALGVGVGLWRVYKNMAREDMQKIAGESA
ncbi:MAG: DUF2157 domain-containing protein [Zoogloeaceae bacterium]|nr:DUF2157 domain-containing protein [Zoogloeaceae bacterium]